MAILSLIGVKLDGSSPTDGTVPRSPAKQPLSWPRGEDGQIAVKVYTRAGDDADLASSTLVASIRRHTSDVSPAVARTLTVTDAAAGEALIELGSADTLGLSEGIAYRLDVWMTDPTSKRWQIVPTSDFLILPAVGIPTDGATAYDGSGALEEADDFIGGSTADGSIGKLGWSREGTGTPALAFQTSTAAHTGVLRVSTSTAPGDSAAIRLGGASDRPFVASAVSNFAAVVRVPNTLTGSVVSFGLVQDAADVTSGGTDAVRFLYDDAAGKWTCITRAGGVQTKVTPASSASLAAVDTWYRLSASFSAGSWRFFVNGVQVAAILTTIPTAALTLAASSATVAGGTRAVDLDLVSIRYGNPRRY